ncbi:ion channel [Deltaproteobacteria bacterium IMCC39524]|nr:ion channel [Deltaproteobacteria bacterium IMCC39524]
MDPIGHLRFSIGALVSIIAIGTFGYSMVEGWSLFDSLYMTVITLATVGIKLTDNEMTFIPPSYTVIEPISVLITLGEIPAIEKLEKIAGGLQQ